MISIPISIPINERKLYRIAQELRTGDPLFLSTPIHSDDP